MKDAFLENGICELDPEKMWFNLRREWGGYQNLRVQHVPRMHGNFSHVQHCDPMDHSLPGSSVHGILQERILEWDAIPFSRGFSQSRY